MIRVTLSLLAALGLCLATAVVCAAAFADATGDLNGDGAVDDADKAKILGAVGTSAGDPGFIAAADYDGDGAISLADVGAWMDLAGS